LSKAAAGAVNKERTKRQKKHPLCLLLALEVIKRRNQDLGYPRYPLTASERLTPGALLQMTKAAAHLFSLVGPDFFKLSFSAARHFSLTSFGIFSVLLFSVI
jgi:hypothetical protein